jgi:HEAT repeat protein
MAQRNVKGLIKALLYKDDIVSRDAACALIEIGEKVVEPLNKKLAVLKQNAAQEKVIRVLGDIGDARAVEPLLICLKQGDPLVRVKVVGALRKLQEIKGLIKALHDNAYAVYQEAASALTAMDAAAVESLIKELDLLEQNEVQERVIGVLENIGDVRAVEPLINCLKRGGEGIGAVRTRAKAADALGTLRDKRAIGPLIASLDQSSGIDPGAFDAWTVGDRASFALARIGAIAVEPLIANLTTESLWARRMTINALSMIKDDRAIPVLKRLLVNEKSSWIQDGIKKALSLHSAKEHLAVSFGQEKISCFKCGLVVLYTEAEKNGGLCDKCVEEA